MQLLYENAIYFLLYRWAIEYTNYEEEEIRNATKVLQEKYSYSE